MRWIAAILLVAALIVAPTSTASPQEKYVAKWNGIPLMADQAGAVRVIRKVFGPRYAEQALRVSWCESRFWVWANNGQYLGLFQMGSWERRTFGHSSNNAWVQARAAHRYFVESGRDWSPWACSAWG